MSCYCLRNPSSILISSPNGFLVTQVSLLAKTRKNSRPQQPVMSNASSRLLSADSPKSSQVLAFGFGGGLWLTREE